MLRSCKIRQKGTIEGMWKKWIPYFRGPTRKRLLNDADLELLSQRICGPSGPIRLDRGDLQILRQGGDALLWESSLVSSVGQAVGMARQAASEMAPAPGRAIRAMVLYFELGPGSGPDDFEAVASTIQQALSKDADMIVGAGSHDEEGIRFFLATSEEDTDVKEGAR